MPLTVIEIKSFKPKAIPYRKSDGGGLYLEINPNGSKYWRYKYRFQGKEKKLAFGVYPNVSLADARNAHREARLLLSKGIDPSSERQARKQREIELKEHSFAAIAHEWHVRYFSDKDPAYAKRVWRSIEKDILPVIGKLPITMVTGPQLRIAFQNIEKRSITDTPHRVLRRCQRIFEYANAMGYTTDDPTRGIKGMLTPHKSNHFAYLTDPQEIGALMRTINGDENQIIRIGLLLCAYTFVRHNNLRKAEWKEFDLDNAMWKIPAEKMKMRKPHMVPLSRQVIALIKQLHTMTSNSPYLFPKRGHIKEPMSEATLLAALRRIGYEKELMTVHGFRHTASTLLNEQTTWHKDAIEAQLAHTDSDKVRGTYNHADYLEERKNMMQSWSDYLDELANINNVVALPINRR